MFDSRFRRFVKCVQSCRAARRQRRCRRYGVEPWRGHQLPDLTGKGARRTVHRVHDDDLSEAFIGESTQNTVLNEQRCRKRGSNESYTDLSIVSVCNLNELLIFSSFNA